MKGLTDNPSYIVEILESGLTLEDVIDDHIYEQTLMEKSAFVVADLGALMRQHACWQRVVPRLQPYFPVKFNSSPVVIEVLSSLGLGFVCTSKAEVNLVLEHGVAPENIILSGVCKQLAHIKNAAKNNIQHLVFENEAELSKISRLHPNAKLLLQLTTEAHAAETSMAFGSSLKSCRHLLEAAKKQGVQVVGVTFHIPSSCQELQQAYTHALSDARCVFDMGIDLGFNMNILDIGGGFTGSEYQLRQVESAIRPLLESYFPPLSGIQLVAQPGSFYVSSAFRLAVNVIAKKVLSHHWDHLTHGEKNEDTEFLYHMNEGVYGPFSLKLLGNTISAPSVHKMKGLTDNPSYIVEILESGLTLEDVIDDHIYEQTLMEKSAFVVADLGALMRQHACWQRVVPRLQPYFPVKFNSSPVVIEHLLCADEEVYPSSLWGPSMDQLDQVVERCLLPELSVGDWLLFSNMGACSLDENNGLSSSPQMPVYYTVSTADWLGMQDAGVTLDNGMKIFSSVPYRV